MPRFLVTYAERGGPAKLHRIAGESARQLKAALQQEGKTGIVIHDDDMMARFKDVDFKNRDRLSPTDEFRLNYSRKVDDVRAYRMRAHGWVLAGVGMLTWAFIPPFSVWDLILAAAGALCGYTATAFYAQGAFAALQRAREWKHWDEHARHLKALRRANAILRLKLIKGEIALHTCVQMAVRDNVERARNALESMRQDLPWTEALFWTRASELHSAVHDHAGKLECAKRAFELGGNDDTHHIDYALTLVLSGRDPDRAEEILNSREPIVLTPAARVFRQWVEAVIALQRKRYETAATHFREALGQIEPIYDPLLWNSIKSYIESGLGRALAHLGDPEGNRLLLNSLPLVVANGNEYEIADCEAALDLATKLPSNA